MFTSGNMVGTLRLEKHLGAGAFGSVFLATEVMLNRKCAVKFIKSANPRQFKEHVEGQILAKCRHENVVEVYDINVHNNDGDLYASIEMEYMPNGSLEAYINNKFLSIKETIKLIIDVLFALEHAHANNILHRDVKPANIMIGVNSAKIADFGIAASVDETKIGSVAGTPVYCAPEIFQPGAVCSVQTEIFSVGMTLFQAISNFTDWGSKLTDAKYISQGDTIKRVGYASYIPRRMRNICNTACNKDPAKRYQTARKMRQALEDLHINIDWHRLDDLHWEGFDEKKRKHTVQICNNDEFIYKINDRKKSGECKKFNTLAEARAYIEKYVYDNTF